MREYIEAEIRDHRRRRRERYLIVFLAVVVSVLVYVGMRFYRVADVLPFSSSLLLFAIINLNVILLLLLLFLTVRNLVKLLFERKKRIMGARLRTKLVLAFVTLSLLPTVILFAVSVQFISLSMEYWFNLQIERSLKKSLEVGQDYYKGIGDEILNFGNNLARVITYEGYLIPENRERLERFIHDKRRELGLTSLVVFSERHEFITGTHDHQIDLSAFKPLDEGILRWTVERGSDNQFILSSPHGDIAGGAVPIFSRTESKAVIGVVALGKYVPGAFVNRLQVISQGLQEYRQLKMLKAPIKASHMITLSIVTLLIIFSSVWFGFYLSKEITVPILELAEGTKRIASGDYDFSIDVETRDEMGDLVQSFNRMTMDLKTAKLHLENANKKLVTTNLELDQRRVYMEIVLANVAAGVISADREGRILTINKSAEKMLDLQAHEILGKDYREVLTGDYVEMIRAFLEEPRLLERGSLTRQIRLSVGNRRLALLVSMNVLRDERDRYLGLVAVFEDLTEIEKAQRMAAWREVARRIAHEVKNPLTPIQLSAQRLKKRYAERMGPEDQAVFLECTGTIIQQVDELKTLVNEFSNFARMPASNPVPSDIRKIIQEALSLYREAHKEIQFHFNDRPDIPELQLDREQIRRVLINLFENAVEAMDGSGEVNVRLEYDPLLSIVILEVADTGRGLGPEARARLFEPYYSTKKHGTGLGLAIVSTIVSDHQGFIRVQGNHPRGTKFIIEFSASALKSTA